MIKNKGKLLKLVLFGLFLLMVGWYLSKQNLLPFSLFKETQTEIKYLSPQGRALTLGYINVPDSTTSLSIIGRLDKIWVDSGQVLAMIDFGPKGSVTVILARTQPELSFFFKRQDVPAFFPTSDHYQQTKLKFDQVINYLKPHKQALMIFSFWTGETIKPLAQVSQVKLDLVKKLTNCNQQLANYLQYNNQPKPSCLPYINQASIYSPYAK